MFGGGLGVITSSLDTVAEHGQTRLTSHSSPTVFSYDICTGQQMDRGAGRQRVAPRLRMTA